MIEDDIRRHSPPVILMLRFRESNSDVVKFVQFAMDRN